jgi:hypothetical protein
MLGNALRIQAAKSAIREILWNEKITFFNKWVIRKTKKRRTRDEDLRNALTKRTALGVIRIWSQTERRCRKVC